MKIIQVFNSDGEEFGIFETDLKISSACEIIDSVKEKLEEEDAWEEKFIDILESKGIHRLFISEYHNL